MGFRSKVKKVTPKVDLQSYNVLVAGGFKVGKTRLWKEVMELHYPNDPNAGILLAFEPGYNTWELDSVIPMHDYDWKFFKTEVVKGLLDEAKTNRISKVIGIDTVDRLMDMASDYILENINKKYGKNLQSLQEVTENIKGENGYVLLKQEVWKQIDLLKNAGYGFFWLAWVKEKETTTIDGLKYNSIELKMSKTGADIFAIGPVLAETFLLLTSSFTIGLAIHAMRLGSKKATLTFMGITLALGLAFLGVEVYEFFHYAHIGAGISVSAFTSILLTTLGTHGAHVTLGFFWGLGIMFQIAKRGFTPKTANKTFIFSLYWHFLDVVWIFIFSFIYLKGLM